CSSRRRASSSASRASCARRPARRARSRSPIGFGTASANARRSRRARRTTGSAWCRRRHTAIVDRCRPRSRRSRPKTSAASSDTSSSPPMPASNAARILVGEARDALRRARSYLPEQLLDAVEKSGLRGRGGAGYPLADKLRAVRRNADGRQPYVVANGYDADPGSPLARTLLARNAATALRGIAIAAHAVDAKEAFVYLHPGATEARAAVERAIADHQDELGIAIEVALGPGGFMVGEESALLAVLESRRAMARQRPPYPASQGLNLRPTLVASIETLAWLPLVVEEQVRASTKLVSVTGAGSHPGVYACALGTSLGDIVSEAGGTTAKLKGLHVGGPTGGILNATRSDTRFDFDDLRVAGTHMGSAQVRAISVGTCIVNEAAKLFAYLA